MKTEKTDLNGAMERTATRRMGSTKYPWLFAACIVSSMSGLCSAAYAIEVSGSIAVTATVVDTCTVQADAIVFNQIGPTQAATAGAGIAIACTVPTTLQSVYVSMGDNSDAGSRRLASVTPDYIPYSVSVGLPGQVNIEATDATTDVSDAFGHFFPGAPDNWASVITANIAATPTARNTGDYSDTMILTVNYNLGAPD